MDARQPNGLTLVLGPANSGKMGHALEWWKERLIWSPVVVVPTVPDARALSGEMARRTGGLVGQSPALNFDGLVRLLIGRSPRYITDLERTFIASRLLRTTPLEGLRSAVQLPGLATALVALFQQFGESGKEPHEVDRILARWSTELETTAFAVDIRRLAAAYATECKKGGLVDRSTAVTQATGCVGGWNRPVVLYGFTSFTLGQRNLIEELSRRVEVLIAFTHDSSRDINLSTSEEIAWWKERATGVIEVSSPSLAYDSAAVAYLERHFMAQGPCSSPPVACSVSEGVRFLLASGKRAEAELAAQEVAGLLRAGLPPGDIAVVVRGVRQWGRLLGQVFDSCLLPYQIDDRRVLRETGIGHAFLNALEGVAHDDARSLLAYLRSPYSGLDKEALSDLELRYRRSAADGSRALTGMAKTMGLEAVSRVWELVEGANSLLAGDGREIGEARFDRVAAEALAADMLRAGLRGGVVGSREVEDDARAFRALLGALASLAELVSGESGALDPQTVLRALAEVDVPASRLDEADQVQILSVQRARARRFKAVVLLGLVEGEFPGRADKVSLLTSAQRTRLDVIGDGLFSPESDQEAALFISSVSRASRFLFLSARDAEDDGSEAVPSYFWQLAKSLLGVGDGDHAVRTLADQVFAPDLAPSPRHFLRSRAAQGAFPQVGEPGGRARISARAWGRPPSCLRSPEVLADLESVQCYSPSSLEAYADCPFKWFMERVVGVDDIDSELSRRVIGQLLHKVLGDIYSRLSSAGLLPLGPENVPGALDIAGTAIDELVQSGECAGSAAEKRVAGWRLGSMIRNLFAMEAAAASELVPFKTELWVGDQNGVDIGGLRLRGRIDRVDVARDTGDLFVFDYKTGAVPAASALGTGKGLQLPLYLLALAAERLDAGVAGGAYLGLSAKKRVGVVMAGRERLLGAEPEGYQVLDEDAAQELFEATRLVASSAVAGMRQGIIAPRSTGDCPSWCSLGAACRSKRTGYRP